MKLGIIGTAGRKDDAEKLKLGHWYLMLGVSQAIVKALDIQHVISGGAAVADHVAVKLFNADYAKKLTFYLPVQFDSDKNRYMENSASQYDTGRVANYYHEEFSKIIKEDSLGQIKLALSSENCNYIIGKGFKDRNTEIAKDSDILLAFTFGYGPKLKPGGSADTMNKFLTARTTTQPCKRAFHFDLNSKNLFEI